MTGYVENPDAVGDPNQTPRVRLFTTAAQVRAQTLKEVAAEFATLADVELGGDPLFPDVASRTCINFIAGWVESWANNPAAPPPWRSA